MRNTRTSTQHRGKLGFVNLETMNQIVHVMGGVHETPNYHRSPVAIQAPHLCNCLIPQCIFIGTVSLTVCSLGYAENRSTFINISGCHKKYNENHYCIEMYASK